MTRLERGEITQDDWHAWIPALRAPAPRERRGPGGRL